MPLTTSLFRLMARSSTWVEVGVSALFLVLQRGSRSGVLPVNVLGVRYVQDGMLFSFEYNFLPCTTLDLGSTPEAESPPGVGSREFLSSEGDGRAV